MAEVKKEKIAYVESSDYIPKEIRKKYGIGEFAKKESDPAKESADSESTENESK